MVRSPAAALINAVALLSHPCAGAPYSVCRVLRLAAYSATVGASCGHHWHRWLEATIHPEAPQCHAAVVKKTALDQLVLSESHAVFQPRPKHALLY